jgi:hypothetical protein
MTGDVRIDEIERLIERLEAATSRLRGGDLSDDEAAELIEECGRVAVQAGTELERRSRGEEAGVATGSAVDQDPLTGPQQDRLL